MCEAHRALYVRYIRTHDYYYYLYAHRMDYHATLLCYYYSLQRWIILYKSWYGESKGFFQFKMS